MASSSLNSIDSELELSQLSIDNNISTSEIEIFQVIYFDIETGGFGLNCDVLQIAMKCSETEFNMYINPSQDIPYLATKINEFTNVGGNLYHRGVKLNSYSLEEVLSKLLEYLQCMGTRSILVAHNCNVFDAPRLINIIQKVSLVEEFRNVVAGFVDSLPMFRLIFPRKRSNGQYKLTRLATKILQLPVEGAHDAIFDLTILQQLVVHCFTYDELCENMQTFDCKVQQFDENKQTKIILNTLVPLEKDLSGEVRTRLAKAGISYGLLVATYEQSKPEAVRLLQQSVDGIPQFNQNGYKVKDKRTEMIRFNKDIFHNFDITTYKYNRTTAVLNDTFHAKVNVDDKLEAVIQVYKFLSNKYRYFPIRLQLNFQQTYASNVFGFQNMKMCGNLTSFIFYKDVINYYFCNFVPDEHHLPPLIPNGLYKIEILFLYLNDEAALLNLYGEIYTPIAYPKK